MILPHEDRTPPLLVEFTGVTGAGKTTLARAVRAEFAARGVPVADAADAVLATHALSFARQAALRSLLVHALAVPPFLSFAASPTGRPLVREAAELIARHAGVGPTAFRLLRNLVKRAGTQVLLDAIRQGPAAWEFVLWDEGMLHAVHNLFVHADSPPDLAAVADFVRRVLRADLVIHVTAPAEQVLECTLRRGHARVSGPHAARAFVLHARAAFEVVAAAPELRGRLLTVDNPTGGVEDLAERASRVADFLLDQRARRLTSPRGAAYDPIRTVARSA